MGGGDLNLKKSWHPSTLKNIERVWKAEQKHEAEQKKIEQLQKELNEERNRQEMRQYAEEKGVVKKRQERLDWMYQGPAAMVNREEYLMGRPVDRAFELSQNDNNLLPTDDSNVPESFSGQGADNVVVDLANKIREDPLFIIRKQEEENKKQLLNNPVRMKQLQQIVKEQLASSKSSKRKKDKKSKDKSKKRHRHHRSKDEGSTSESDSSEGSYVHHKSAKSSERKYRHGDGNEMEDDTFYRSNTFGLIETKNLLGSSQKRLSSRKQSTPEKLKLPRRTRSRSKSPYIQQSQRRKLMPKEMELKRQQMLNNAKWREEQRNKNMQRFRKEEHQENALDEQSKASGAMFLKPFLSNATSNSSVESRVKSNIYNIQRSRADMETNFARR